MIGKRYLVPYRRLVPIWRYGQRHNRFGERVADGWYCDKYEERPLNDVRPPSQKA